MRRLLAALDRYWFAPAPLADLALTRIVAFGVQTLIFLDPVARQLHLARADASLFQSIPALSALMLPFGGWGARPGETLLVAVWSLALIAGVAAALGLFARGTMPLAAAAHTFIVAHEYSYGEHHHPEALLILTLWILALAPSAAVWSLDALRRRLRQARRTLRFTPEPPGQSPFARWPLRLVQWMFALVYFSAGLSKLVYGGLGWFNGYTLSYYFLEDGIRHGSWPGMVLAAWPELLVPVAIAAVLFELTFFLVLIRPALAWLYLPMGAAMHTGIYVIQRAPFFQFIWLYVVFAEPLRRHRPAFLRPRVRAGRWTVVYDGRCPLCIRTMTALDVLDTGRRLAYLDLERDWSTAAGRLPGIAQEDARAAMHVIAPDGRVTRGFAAFRELARALPVLWPVRPLLALPGAERLGDRFYGRVAHARARVVCVAESCGVGAGTGRDGGRAGGIGRHGGTAERREG